AVCRVAKGIADGGIAAAGRSAITGVVGVPGNHVCGSSAEDVRPGGTAIGGAIDAGMRSRARLLEPINAGDGNQAAAALENGERVDVGAADAGRDGADSAGEGGLADLRPGGTAVRRFQNSGAVIIVRPE